MDELTLDTLKRRLDRVERENRRMKCVGAVLLVGIAAVLLMGQAASKPGVIEALK
jgi:hypothetical protein